ncbi:MAG: NPCBM/NEW2 domain-containing protein, partial [Lachnospiraceae bacterium]|nr:NPCBM/NEW2 domain-containing protein [Lachnospiraceae bacterium]
SGASGKILIEDCNFAHTHDDPINIHGTFTRVEQRIDDYTLKLKYIHHQQGGFPQYHVGDMVQFFTRDTLESTDGEKQYEVSEIISNPGQNGNDLKTMVIKFKQPLPSNLTDTIGNEPKYVAENVTYAPSVEIRNCTFKNVSTRGILCTTRNKVVIENNIFYPTSMASIFLSNDSNTWYESGPIRDMTIRGNTFYVKDIGGKTSWRYASAVYIHPVTKNSGLPPATNPVHKNITIEDNTFYMDEDTVVKAESVDNLIFRNNKVLRMDPQVSLSLNPAQTAMETGATLSLNLQKTGNTNNQQIDNIFHFTKSKDVSISGNTYDDGLKRYLVSDADTRTTLKLEDKIISIVNNENGTPSEAVGEVTFVNSNPEAVYVDSYGNVTAMSAGSAKIYAYYRWNGTVIKSNEVTLTITGETVMPEELNKDFTIKREDSGYYELSKNSYQVDLQGGDIYQTYDSNNLKNLLLYQLKGEEKNNFRALVKVEGLPAREGSQWDTASFILYKDDDNYITVGKKSHFDGFCYVVEKNGTATENHGNAAYNSSEAAWFGITKLNNTVTLSARTEEGQWDQIAEITDHTLGEDYQLGFGAWEENDRSKKITFRDFKIGSADQSFEDLENTASIDFLTGIEKNPVVTGQFASNYAVAAKIAIEELGFEQSAPIADFSHIKAEAATPRATLKVTKEAGSKEVIIYQGDYRTQLQTQVEGQVYTVPVEFVNGMNTFYVRVYAEDGITYKQHIVAVTYMPNYVEKDVSDGLLKEIIFDGKDITNEYFISAGEGTRSTVKASIPMKVTVREGAQVTFGVEGSELPVAVGAQMEGSIPISVGSQRVKIVVSYEGQEKVYYLKLEKSSYLSDYEWISATYGYGNGVNRDANHNGSTLRLANEQGQPVEFRKGLGTHAASIIKYDISGIGFEKLHGYVGLDYIQYGAANGDVQFRVLIDGVQLFDSGVMGNTAPMKEIDIEIPEGARELELNVNTGSSGNNWNDHANWADMKFYNGEKPGEGSGSEQGGTTPGASDNDSGDVSDNDQNEETDIPEKIWVAGVESLSYTGAKVTHTNLQVYDGRKKLTEGKDYTISYKNNTNVYPCTDEEWEAYTEIIAQGTDAINANSMKKEIKAFASKAPQVIIKMKGDYSGSKTLHFKITPLNIEKYCYAQSLTVLESNKAQKPKPIVTRNGKALVANKDYIFAITKYPEGVTEAKTKGTYEVTITGKGNYSGETKVDFVIADKSLSLSKAKIGKIDKITWTTDIGTNGAKPEPTVTLGGKTLTKNIDFIYEYGKDENGNEKNINKQAGTAYVTIKAIGDKYFGSKTVSFKIEGTPISKATYSVPEFYYTGQEIRALEEGVTITAPGSNEPLVRGNHFTASYSKNKNQGIGIITVTGNPEYGYTGTKKVTFKIKPASLEGGYTVSMNGLKQDAAGKFEVPYTAGGATPVVTVKAADGKELIIGTDYTVTYKNNKAVTTKDTKSLPTVEIKGKGNYTGTLSDSFTIIKKVVSDEDEKQTITIKVTDKVEKAGKNGWKQTFKVIDENGKVINKNEYDVVYTLASNGTVLNDAYKEPVKTGEKVCVTVTFKASSKNYEGRVSETYNILAKGYDISKATIKIVPQEYTGSPVLIDDNSQLQTATLKVDKNKTLTLRLNPEEGDNPDTTGYIEVIDYQKNLNKGTAKVTLKGTGNLGGEKTVTFKITQRSIVKYWMTEKMDILSGLVNLLQGFGW